MKKKSELIIKRGANHPGMTLIEVLVALAISGIIAITFLPIFSTGIKYLVNNGYMIRDMYTDQDSMEKEISLGAASEDNTMSIIFPGKIIEIKGTDYNTIRNYNLFIPKK
jgi:prepilin-type N-terminal cleavage/methylation domain-containing protein